jgi:hypothetical protein
MYESVSPKIASPGSAQVTTGYFGDLAFNPLLRLTTTSSSVEAERIYPAVVVVVGTLESGLRPGREPAERQLRHRCPLVHTSGSKS